MINLFFFLIMFCLPSLAYEKVDFDVSMQTAAYPHVAQAHQSAILGLDFFKKLFEKNDPSIITSQETLKIPKIIHQIWLGKKMPDEYVPFRKSWITHHPGWTFIFWTDNQVNYDQGRILIESFEALDHYLINKNVPTKFIVVDVKKLAFNNRNFYDAARNYGEKSDILKWEIVYRLGGLYVDTDYECLKSLNDLHYMYDFYTGIQPLDTNMVQLGAALYAAYPKHPILKRCVEGIKENEHIPQIISKTGPIHFTKSFFRTAHSDKDINVALPATYFYPCSYEQKGMPASVWQCPESYAIHHWAGSWLHSDAFERKK